MMTTLWFLMWAIAGVIFGALVQTFIDRKMREDD